MCSLTIISTFNDFSNSEFEKSLNFTNWLSYHEEILNSYNNNILKIEINQTFKSLLIETKLPIILSNYNVSIEAFREHELKLYNPISKMYFNYEDKNKYIINYEFLEWNNLNE